MRELKIIGLMSGTSIDGLDLAACTFTQNDHWTFDLNHSKTVRYTKEVVSALQHLDSATALDYARFDHKLGRLFGKEVNQFITETGFVPDYISSHGHTIFHQPQHHFTTQIGHPSAICALTNTSVIADFRTTDVHLSGQGAPLVPIGDSLLFKEFTYCLNLGGIANISIKSSAGIKAFDVCIANMALNYLAKKANQAFDNEGEIARSGTLNSELLTQLNQIEFHHSPPPKSIGKEWFDTELKPLLDASLNAYTIADIMHTVCEHIATQIGAHTQEPGKMIISGGGTLNTYLVSRITELSLADVHIPPADLIDFKEAIIFAFLGALFVSDEVNILKDVTGASTHHIGGCLYKSFGRE